MHRAIGRMAPILSDERREMILEDGIRMLDRLGVECSHEPVRDWVAGKPGLRAVGNRLHFSSERCREHVERIRSRIRSQQDPAREKPQKWPPEEAEPEVIRLKAVGPWTCLSVLDPDTGAFRQGTLRDVEDVTRMQVAMGVQGRKICAPVCPADVPAHLRCLAMARGAWTYANDTGAGVPSSVPEIEYVWEMGQLAEVPPPYCYAEFAISPLAFNAHVLDQVYRLRGRPALAALAVDPGPIPTLGGTGPMAFRAVLAQSVAETLGGSLVVDLLTDGAQVPLCSAMTAVATDLRFGTVNFSSPEAVFLLQAGFEVGAHLTAVPGSGGALRSIAKRPDAQAAAEKTLCALVGALNGARTFCDVGQLSVDEVFSYEQFVIDLEILAGAERFVNGFPFEEGPDPVDLVREGLATRNFLEHPLTLERMREYYRYPDLFDQRMLNAWQSDGGRSVETKAREIAREKIASQGPRLDDATRGKLNTLYERAARDLAPAPRP